MYPWAEWFDGREWNLVRGRDFWGKPEVFKRRIQNAANGRSVKVRIDISEDFRFILVQAAVRA